MIRKNVIFLGIIIIFFLGYIAIADASFKEAINLPVKGAKMIKEKVNSLKADIDRKRLINLLGGQEKVDELFKNSKLFCVDDTDCLWQPSSWCCPTVTNRYHYEPGIEHNGVWGCMAVCDESVGAKIACINNECQSFMPESSK